MADPSKVVAGVLKTMGVRHVPSETGYFFYFDKGEGPEVDGYAHVLHERRECVIFLEYQKTTPNSRKMRMCEFVTRANWGIGVGNFELDFETGYVRYKVGIDFGDASLPREFVRRAIVGAMSAVEEYDEGIRAVMAGQMSAQEAIAASEGK